MRFLIPLLRNWSWLSRESRGLVVRCAANTQLSPSPNTQRVASYHVILSIGDCCAPQSGGQWDGFGEYGGRWCGWGWLGGNGWERGELSGGWGIREGMSLERRFSDILLVLFNLIFAKFCVCDTLCLSRARLFSTGT